MTYAIFRVSRKGKPLTRAIKLGAGITADNAASAIRHFLDMAPHYQREVNDLRAEPIKGTK